MYLSSDENAARAAQNELADQIAVWIREQVERAGCKGVVFGLSGGVNSAVVAGLAQRALGGQAAMIAAATH